MDKLSLSMNTNETKKAEREARGKVMGDGGGLPTILFDKDMIMIYFVLSYNFSNYI